jgi:hypothetical protein
MFNEQSISRPPLDLLLSSGKEELTSKDLEVYKNDDATTSEERPCAQACKRHGSCSQGH